MTRPDPPQHDPSQHHERDELSSLESPAWWASSPSLSFFVRHQRLLSWLGALALTLTLMGGLLISQISARHGLLVFGSDPALWCAGGRAALRVEARALTLGERAALLSARVHFERPAQGGSPIKPQPLTQRLGVSLQGGVELPKEGGEWLMVIETEALGAAGAQASLLKGGLPERLPQDLSVIGERVALRATLTLKLASTPSAPIPALEEARTPDLLAERQGDSGELASFAAGQRLSFELPSEVIVMGVEQKHTPLTGSVSLELNGQPLPPLTLNEDGLASLIITPQSPTIDLTLTRSAPQGQQGELIEVKERLWPEAHQFSLTPSTQRVSPKLSPVLALKSTQAARALFVDLWWGERWIDTFVAPLNESREGSLRLTLPKIYEWGEPSLMKGREPSPQLLWAQTYHSPYQPGEVRGGAYLLYAPAPQAGGDEGAHKVSDQALGAWLQRELKGFKLTQKRWPHLAPERWLQPLPLRFALGRVKRPQANPQLIINSVASAAATASEMKARYQVRFLLVMLALGALTLLGLGGLMWAHERHLSALSESLELRRNRWEVLGWLAQVTFVLSCFFGGMIYLIYVIRW